MSTPSQSNAFARRAEAKHVFKFLSELPPGRIKLETPLPKKWWQRRRRVRHEGYVDVTEEGGLVSIMWLYGANYHLVGHSRDAFILDINKDSATLHAYYRAAISMWLKWGITRDRIHDTEELHRAIDAADWLYGKLTTNREANV